MAVSEALHTPRAHFPFAGECINMLYHRLGSVRIPDSHTPHETYTGTRIEDGLTAAWPHNSALYVYDVTSSQTVTIWALTPPCPHLCVPRDPFVAVTYSGAVRGVVRWTHHSGTKIGDDLPHIRKYIDHCRSMTP
jgi:hypothetical protein